MVLNINNATNTDYSNIPSHTIASGTVNAPIDTDETVYINERFAKDWGYFMRVPKLQSAILMKAIWTVGKGYECDPDTEAILNHIIGNGKETFQDILFNSVVGALAARDSFTEIVKDEKSGLIINMKTLDPSTMSIIYDSQGMIKRYEQRRADKSGRKNPITYKPNEIFHLPRYRLAGSMCGISVPESVENIILADDKSFNVLQRITSFQAVPFIIWKLKTDDTAKISSFRAKLKKVNSDGEDLIIPDDENLISWEIVQVNPSPVLMAWRDNVNSELYRAVGMPLILFGSSGSTESGGKMEYFGHETVFEFNQNFVEKQFEAQTGLKINLLSPTSLMNNLATDQNKDGQSNMNMQPNDITAGVGE
jgi:hypothetical protein